MSSIIILRGLMSSVKDRLKSNLTPEPWQHFDLICGSGFGGLLALMLGRLQMVRCVILRHAFLNPS